ncbi:efflux RND transporter periplasmic adaptor subunit [Halomonas sediminis]
MLRRRPPFSYLLATLITLGLLVWLALGDFQHFQSEAPAATSATIEPPGVEVSERVSTDYLPTLSVQGQLEAQRNVTLRVNQTGQVMELPVAQGSSVGAGDTLLILDSQALPERLALARDELALAQAELSGAESLRQRQLISQPDLLRLRSAVTRSLADVAELERQYDDTRPTAPFDGKLDQITVELGDLLRVGESWGRLIDDRTLLASGWVAQQRVRELSPGLAVDVRLLDGRQLSGELTYVASRADEATRSFQVEAEIDNPQGLRLAGASAELTITLPARQVHVISPALLVLDEAGQLAVKHLDDQNRVQQTQVELVSADAEAARVTGLPSPLRLITLGGGLVNVGERVEFVVAETDQEVKHAPTD